MNNVLIHLLVGLLALLIGSAGSLLARDYIHQQKEVQRLVNISKPVVSDMKIVNSYVEDDKLYMRMYGKKVRDCGAPVVVYGSYGANREYAITEILFLDDKDVDDKFKVADDNFTGNVDELIDFGWWGIKPDPSKHPISLYSIHKCDGTLVTTHIGTYSFNDYK
jgi:hypothetical protein